MDTQKISPEEIQTIRSNFKEIREKLEPFIQDRNFKLSNPQIFTFLTFAPAALAIASDGTVDDSEVAMLEKINRGIKVESMVDLNLYELMSYASEPEDCMLNEEFDMRAGSELLYLSRNMEKYRDDFIEALKILLKFDKRPDAEGSMTKSFVDLMNSVVDNNMSENKEVEKQKMDKLLERLDLN